MTVPISGVSNSQSFGTWVERTRQHSKIFRENTVTVDLTAAGNTSSGNGFVVGVFGGTTLVANNIRGGTVSTAAPWSLTANVTFLGAAATVIGTILSNSTIHAVSWVPTSWSVIPTANAVLGGVALNINAATVNVTSTVSMSGTVGLSGPVNLTGGQVSASANVSLTGANLSVTGTKVTISSNVNVTGANTTIGSAQVTFSGTTVTSSANLSVTARTTTLDLTVTNGVTWANTHLFNGEVTVNALAHFNANTDVGGTTLFVDPGNDRVGINTASVDAGLALKVVGNTKFTHIGFTDGTFITSANAFNTTGDGIRLLNDGNSSITIGSEQITITSNGVVIGVLDSFSNYWNIAANIACSYVSASANVTANNVRATSSISIANTLTLSEINYTVTNTDSQPIDSVASASWKTVEWLVQMSQDSTNSYHASKVLATHDGTTAISTEFATLTTNNNLGTLTTAIVSGDLRLILAPSVASMSIKLTRTALSA